MTILFGSGQPAVSTLCTDPDKCAGRRGGRSWLVCDGLPLIMLDIVYPPSLPCRHHTTHTHTSGTPLKVRWTGSFSCATKLLLGGTRRWHGGGLHFKQCLMARHGATIVEAIFDTFINRPVASVVVAGCCRDKWLYYSGGNTGPGCRWSPIICRGK